MMNRRTKSVSLLLTAAMVCGMVLAPGCEKKKPPPPPPPPPPPAEPVEVSFDSIMQTLKADVRVKAPNSLGITDESFARAAVLLADAFAKADAEKVKGMVSNRAKAVVDSMVNDGSWAALQPRIEEVRIVYAGVRAAVGDAEKAAGIAQMKAMQAGQMKAFEDVLIKKGLDKNETARFMAEYQRELDDALAKATAADARVSNTGETPDPAGGVASDSPTMALLFAVQTPDGAELLGWTARKAGDNWVFTNASTLAHARRKAADWDGVGMFGFSLGVGKSAAPPAARRSTEDTKPSDNTTPAPARDGEKPADKPNDKPPRDPRKLVPGQK